MYFKEDIYFVFGSKQEFQINLIFKLDVVYNLYKIQISIIIIEVEM